MHRECHVTYLVLIETLSYTYNSAAEDQLENKKFKAGSTPDGLLQTAENTCRPWMLDVLEMESAKYLSNKATSVVHAKAETIRGLSGCVLMLS
jgi:hypothetical protein